jgi:hypothetical protein
MNRGDIFRRVFTNPLGIRAVLWTKLPLAGFAGLRVERIDASGAAVSVPAGWKTQNPFRSTYFAAQAMAAELSTGAPALMFIEESGAKVSSLVTELSAKFTRKATQTAVFTFSNGASMKAAVDETVRTGEPVVFRAQTVGRQPDGTVVAEFEIVWSFKRKS